ncbi:Sulfotransferase domain protein [Legionella massiliensis]|uniref:Sulfotransferase domain protein n=1 Tax=Legionella massiliensis TaxID=1034943 RepID=A0A078KX59_9GAMM|nr:sulfotransferase domain-containing protein [Legionella massiliensis]CDZ77632.1 Sulfotransferase domain protein [Legionella massiliensis]CEE13370.1 Sulfotransferase domain protein [Legionella massiliensis]
MILNKGIVWLASYPKSGNTWFRIVLSNLLNSVGQTLDLNKETIIGTGAAARSMMDKALGFDSNLLNEDELEKLRPLVYCWQAEQQKQPEYFKIHDAFYELNNRLPLVPRDASAGVVYFLRNPLDVAISFAHHMNTSLDRAIDMMNDPFLTLKGFTQRPMAQFRQRCSSWTGHVKSWTSIKDIPLLILRYEDMSFATLETFSQAFQFLNMSVSEAMILAALEKSNFEHLKNYEQQFGFRESSPLAGNFFRKGIVGDWESTLNNEQIGRIIRDHGVYMRRFGYLDEQDQPVRMKKDCQWPN